MEAAYGTNWRAAIEDSIRRMKSGSNRPEGGDSTTRGILDWLNNSVGAVMFLNTRSALLQTISSVNFINWDDNNIFKAGLAFANQKQFWKLCCPKGAKNCEKCTKNEIDFCYFERS